MRVDSFPPLREYVRNYALMNFHFAHEARERVKLHARARRGFYAGYSSEECLITRYLISNRRA